MGDGLENRHLARRDPAASSVSGKIWRRLVSVEAKGSSGEPERLHDFSPSTQLVTHEVGPCQGMRNLDSHLLLVAARNDGPQTGSRWSAPPDERP